MGAESRMKKTRQRYRREHAPIVPETVQRIVADARALRSLEAPVREMLHAVVQMFERTIHKSESVPIGTVSET